MCADAVCPGVGCFSLWILRMNMCERIYFTVDVSGTSNLFSRFVHLWLAWGNEMWGSQWVQPMETSWLDHDGPWCQELHHDHDDCD